jgi:hypothetical protein
MQLRIVLAHRIAHSQLYALNIAWKSGCLIAVNGVRVLTTQLIIDCSSDIFNLEVDLLTVIDLEWNPL